jgi:hypothetical protein
VPSCLGSAYSIVLGSYRSIIETCTGSEITFLLPQLLLVELCGMEVVERSGRSTDISHVIERS